MSKELEQKLYLELGQVIQILAPANRDIHENIFLIEYLDDTLIKLINDKDLNKIEIQINNNQLTDETIEEIIILASPEEKGYARQNNLVPNKWISIEFGGDIPIFINGKITDLEEDAIEITTYDTSKKIYIDFGYKGVPLNLPINNIKPFFPPELRKEEDEEEKEEDDLQDEEEDDDDLELIIDNETLKQNKEGLFIDINDIEISDESLGEVTEMVHVDEENKRFGIDAQTQDILDELLAEYPSVERTSKILNNIQITIERFKQLRLQFSTFNEVGNAENIKHKGPDYKPLVEKLKNLNQKCDWLIPVARNIHKIYDVDIPQDETIDDAQLLEFRFDMQEIMELFNHYKSNTVPDGQNKYVYINEQMKNYLTPFINPTDNTNIITQLSVQENLDVLINNFDDFMTTMAQKNNNISSQQFIIDKYNLGLNRLFNPDIKNKHSKAIITPLTDNDKISLLGFITLSEQYIQYSRINLPTTSIYQKSNLHFFNFIKSFSLNSYGVQEEKIINESDEKNDEEQDIDQDIFKYKKYYSFEERRLYVDRTEDNIKEEIYHNFLDNMIPKTKTLFNLIKKYIKNGTSFIKIIEYLEPFSIYNDDISFKQYEAIAEFIYDEIEKHKQLLIKNTSEFQKYLRGNKTYILPSILPNLIKSEYRDILEKQFYNIKQHESTDLSLKKIKDYDSGRLYNTVLTLSELTFSQPISIEEKINEELKETEKNIDEKKSDEECKKYTLVKKYIDLDELTNDNGTDAVFVDKKYDETPYDIGQSWLSNQDFDINTPEGFQQAKSGLTNFLIENNGVSQQKADIDAEAMILKVRKVVEGEYAILDIGDETTKYYIRQNNNWKYDKNLSGKSIYEVNFCNLKDNCLKIKETCTNLDSSKELLKKNILEDIVNRFDKELQLSIEELRNNLLLDLSYQKKNLHSLKTRKIHKLMKRDLLQKKIGEKLKDRELIISPYEQLRDEILSQNDMIKKFNDIRIFVEKYCRIGNNDEDGNWFYCIDTDIKLLPSFFMELVTGFNNNNYIKTLETIYKKRGVLSDDGDKWVDKHSGYYISNIDLDSSEGYNKDGYKIKSRDIMEESVSDKMLSNKLKETTQEYSTILAKRIEKILQTFDNKLHLSSKKEYNFIIKTVMESMNKNVPDEKLYREKYAQIVKKKPKSVTFERKSDQVFMYSLISAYIVAIQCSIPNIVSNKAFGDCKKSFSGFPLDGNSDLTFVEYVVCMILTLRRSERPWNIIPKALSGKNKKKRTSKYDEKKVMFVEKIKNFITDKILINEDINQKIRLKKEWNKHNKTEKHIPFQFDVHKWHTFLPPLKSIKTTNVTNIANTFETTLKSRIREGSYQQFAHLWSLYGKITSFSVAIIQSVQRAIDKEPLLLETKGGMPFLENACCNEGEPNTNLYFSTKQNTIQKHNKIIENLSNIYYTYKGIHPPTFNILKNTKRTYPPISKTFSKHTIYLAFIKYCKFNSGIILDSDLQRICGRNTSKFQVTDTIEEKILAMEAEGLNYSNDSLNVLLNIVNKRNILHYDLDPSIITEKSVLENTLKYLINKNNLIGCHSQLLVHLQNIVDRFDVVSEKTDNERILLLQYLKDINIEMGNKITEKMNERGELTQKIRDIFIEFTSRDDDSTNRTKVRKNRFILNWESIGDNTIMTSDDETGFKIFDTIKKMVIYLCKTYPNIILNKVDYTKKYVPKHWLKGSKKLSDRHKQDIIQFMLKDGKGLDKFYDNDNITSVLQFVLDNNDDLLMLLDSIPFYSGIINDKNIVPTIFNGEIIKNIAHYALLSAFSLYISAFETDFDFNDEGAEKQDVSVIIGQKEILEKDTCKLLVTYIKKIEDNKKLLNVSIETINSNVLKTKTKEKEQIVKRLGDLSVEEREIENMLKNSSLGEWSLGKTKAIFEYDDRQYDKEREKLEKDALMEMKTGGLDDVSEFAREIYNISDVVDVLENSDISDRISHEVYNLDGLPEDDDFGDGDNQGDYN